MVGENRSTLNEFAGEEGRLEPAFLSCKLARLEKPFPTCRLAKLERPARIAELELQNDRFFLSRFSFQFLSGGQMYCSACGTPLAPGLSYCNRCGMNLKARSEQKQTGAIAAFLTAITLIGTIGLGIMLGGALTLTNEAHLKEELVGFFMVFTFLIVIITEILLFRQLSRLTGSSEKKALEAPQQVAMPAEFRAPQPPALAESLPSVTENTTRTLEYSRNEPSR
jgi:hypothetical protein